MTSEASPGGPLTSSPVSSEGATAGANHRTARLIAIVAGLLGAVLAVATPFLPVTQTTAQLNWPQNGLLQSVDAPLIGYVPTDLEVSIPCRAAAGLVDTGDRLEPLAAQRALEAVQPGITPDRRSTRQAGHDYEPSGTLSKVSPAPVTPPKWDIGQTRANTLPTISFADT